MSDRINIAVYGTLRKGCRNNYVMVKAGGTLLLEGVEVIGLKVMSTTSAPFPIAMRSSGAKALVDVYSVPLHGVIGCLDKLEGYVPGRASNLYNRIQLADFEFYEVANIKSFKGLKTIHDWLPIEKAMSRNML